MTDSNSPADVIDRLDPGSLIVYRSDDGPSVGQVRSVEGDFVEMVESSLWVKSDQIVTDGVVGDD